MVLEEPKPEMLS